MRFLPLLRAIFRLNHGHSFDALNAGVFAFDRNGRIHFANLAARRMLGGDGKIPDGARIQSVLPDLAEQLELGILRTGLRLGRVARLDQSEFDAQFAVSRDSNTANYLAVVQEAVANPSDERLIETSAQLRAIIDTAVDGIIIADAKGAIRIANPACQRLFGWNQEELIGKNLRILMPPEFSDKHDKYLERYIETGRAGIIGVGRQVVGQRRDGSVFPMELSVGETEYSGERYFVGLVHDVTDRVEAEQKLVQSQKMEIVGQLAGGVAHDFNNLLQVVMGNAELIAGRLASGSLDQELCLEIVRAAERGNDLTSKLLAFSRKQDLKPVVFDVVSMVRNMERLLRRTVPAEIKLNFAFHDDIACVKADPTWLEASLLNLLVNAQHAVQGAGRIDVVVREFGLSTNGVRFVRISVKDTGCGIPEEHLERVCEPFFTTKAVGEGSGLGLSMVSGFIEQSNGQMRIESTVGVGTTIHLSLPLVANVEMPRPDRGDQAPMRTMSHKVTVLCVEDDDDVSRFAIHYLKTLGYKVIAARDGHEALLALQRGTKPDILFTDIMMPGGLSGFDLYDKVKKQLPSIRVLYTSGYALEKIDQAQTIEGGINIIPKPYRLSELRAMLEATLKSNAEVNGPEPGHEE